MATINRVGHVVLAVRDPKASAQFYVEVLACMRQGRAGMAPYNIEAVSVA